MTTKSKTTKSIIRYRCTECDTEHSAFAKAANCCPGIGGVEEFLVQSYKIVRIFQDEDRSARTTKRGLTLEEAQAHCQRPDTRGGDVEQGTAWFDAYESER